MRTQIGGRAPVRLTPPGPTTGTWSRWFFWSRPPPPSFCWNVVHALECREGKVSARADLSPPRCSRARSCHLQERPARQSGPCTPLSQPVCLWPSPRCCSWGGTPGTRGLRCCVLSGGCAPARVLVRPLRPRGPLEPMLCQGSREGTPVTSPSCLCGNPPPWAWLKLLAVGRVGLGVPIRVPAHSMFWKLLWVAQATVCS